MAKEINSGYEIVRRSKTADGDIVLGYNLFKRIIILDSQ